MRQFQNSVLDFKLETADRYESAPLETAWASEAIFFVRVEEVKGKPFRFLARPQISVDGVSWIDEGSSFPPIEGEGQFALRVRHFGGWLRLIGAIESAGASATLTTNLILKE